MSKAEEAAKKRPEHRNLHEQALVDRNRNQQNIRNLDLEARRQQKYIR